MLSRLILTLTAFALALDTSPAASQTTAPQPAAVPQAAPAPQRATNPQPVKPPRPIAETAVDSSSYQIWFVLKPDGLQFVQTPDELNAIQENPPADAFVIACHEFEMKGTPSKGNPRYVLLCRQAMVAGRYGTQRWVSMEGQDLRYDTQERELQLTGSDDKPVRFSVEDGDELNLTAPGIRLQLGASTYKLQAIGVQMEFHAKPIRTVQPAAHSDDGVYRPYYNALPQDAVPAPSPYRDPSAPLPKN